MTKFLGRLNLKMQIGLIGIISTIGLLLFGAVYQYGTTKLDRFQQMAEASQELTHELDEMQIALLNARRAEKDFLFRKDEQYIQRHAQIVDEARTILGDLGTKSTGTSLADNLPELNSALDDYSNAFNDVAATQRRIGLSETQGLLGSLRASVGEVEDLLKQYESKELTILMLMMRRHEKDFLARMNAKYVASMEAAHTEFNAALTEALLPFTVKSQIIDRMNAYHQDFISLSEGVLGFNGQLSGLSDTYARMEPILAEAVAEQDQIHQAALSGYMTTRDETRNLIWGALACIVLAVVVCCVVIGNGIAKPILTLEQIMKRLASGDLEAEVTGRDRRDEVGKMAAAVEVLKSNSLQARQLEAERAAADARAEEQRKAVLMQVAGDFESKVKGIVEAVASAAFEMEAAAQTMVASSEQTSRQSTAVASASEEASTNVNMVAGATEELSASIQEISSQMASSTKITTDAVHEADRTNQMVEGLSISVQAIGDVVKLISDIASQTNLLALNATIEAARAGEAGKGFAVVASEVKSLATQTAKATDEIQAKVAEIQGSASATVGAIQSIGSTIVKINEIAASVASAVEEQGAATRDIANNVQQAAGGTQDVSRTIQDVMGAANEAGSAATQLLGAAGGLARDAEQMRKEVDAFLQTIRAA